MINSRISAINLDGHRNSYGALKNLLMICFLLVSPLTLASQAITQDISGCISGQAGPIATLALLRKKEQVSNKDFYSYWRDIHGMLATRIPGFWTYRQYHFDKEVFSLRRLPLAYKIAVEPLHGFADVSYCNQKAIAGLARSPEAALIKDDEKNVFDSSYLYAAVQGESLTLTRLGPLADDTAIAPGENSIMLLAKSEAETLSDFKTALGLVLQQLPAVCPTLRRLRVNYFQPYDPNAWPAPKVNHQPSQIMSASVEFQFPDRQATLDCLSNHPEFSPLATGASANRLQLVYGVNKRYSMVVDGRISLMGLRGLPAIELIERVGAGNQVSGAVLKTLYGAEVR